MTETAQAMLLIIGIPIAIVLVVSAILMALVSEHHNAREVDCRLLGGDRYEAYRGGEQCWNTKTSARLFGKGF